MTEQTFLEIIGYLKDVIAGTPFENKTYVVGGAVRDFYMKNPIKDIDIVIELPNGGLEFAQWLRDYDFTCGDIVMYPTYGTAMFQLKKFPSYEIECVQTRKEQYKDKDSRNPETSYGTLYEDIMRRDLTCNALLYDITNCQVLDLTGKGIEDIKNKIIRSPLE